VKVAFCVVTWNNADVIGQCLDSVLAQEGVDAEVLVIDNASTDDTLAVLGRYPGVRVTASSENTGFAHGNNVLIRQAMADPAVGYVALVNSDAVLAPNWARELVAFAEARPHVGCLQGLTLDYYDHARVDSTHIFVNGRLQGQQHGYGEARADTYNPRKVFGVNAAAAMYSRAMIEDDPDAGHGLFDERFYMYYEDVDLCFRALVAGFDHWFVPAAVAYHMGSASGKKRSSIYSPMMVARNQPAVIFKNAPASVVLRSVKPALRGEWEFLNGIRREFGTAAALRVAGSLLTGIARLPLYAGSRRRIRRRASLPDDYLLTIMNHDGVLG